MAGFVSKTFALLQISIFFTLLNSMNVQSRSLSEYVSSRAVVHGGMDSEFLAVQGVVFCQSSEHLRDHISIPYSSGLAGATIRLQCNIKEITLAEEMRTNKNGDFTILLPKEYADFCQVFLISSPDEKCSSPTNLNGGLDGTHLNYSQRVINDAAMISSNTINVGPFAFVPELSDKRILYNPITSIKFTFCDFLCNYNCGCCACTYTTDDTCQCPS